MRQNLFEKNNGPLWKEFSGIVRKYGNRKDRRSADMIKFPFLYRKVCNHYALALQRQYSPTLVTSLHTMVLEGHRILYRRKTFFLRSIAEFIWSVFPETVRRYYVHLLIAGALFYIPALSIGTACYLDSELIYSIVPAGQVEMYESMYNPSNERIGVSRERSSDTNFMMFGFYIRNNIGIGFRTFAGGMLAGLGVIFFLLYNGIIIGTIAGHLTGVGYGPMFWQFVTGHSSFELTGVVISGAGGLILAQQLFSPGGYSRSDALKKKGPEALKLMIGGFVLFVIAAFVEAFWSSQSLPHSVKFSAGGICWILLFLYLGFGGRKRSKI